MICIGTVNAFCYEDISKIENYDKATADETQTWHCHHRLETERNMSRQQLKDENLYYNRPANELIFMQPYDHKSLHKQGKPSAQKGKKLSDETKEKLSESKKGSKNPMYGKNAEDYMTAEAIKEKRRKQSEAQTGKHHSEEAKQKMREAWKKRKLKIKC